MLIREIKKEPDFADVGGLEATVKNSSAVKLEGGEYTQCVNLTDHTGTIRAKFSYGGNRRQLCNGTVVNIVTAVRKDPGIVVLNYSIPTTSEPEPGSPYEWKPDENMTKADWEAKDKRMAKMCSLNNATQLVLCIAEIMKKGANWEAKDKRMVKMCSFLALEIKKVANDFLDWIYE